MKFCDDHWDKLRKAIEDRGLDVLVSSSGKEAFNKTISELSEGTTIDNFDPLLAAYWSIFGNVINLLGIRNPSSNDYLMSEGAEDPVEGYGEKYIGRTWPRCPLCYLNLAHEMTCSHPQCELEKINGFEWMIDRAADDAKNKWDEMKI